jgi:hypothetical protein
VWPRRYGHRKLLETVFRLPFSVYRKKAKNGFVGADRRVRPRESEERVLNSFQKQGKMVKPHGRLVPVGSTHYCASTSGLSTWWSTRGLEGSCDPGDLFLRSASRLDAFSGYPGRTWLPGTAPGGTTGTLAVRPSRSSRTRDSSSQISYAHNR